MLYYNLLVYKVEVIVKCSMLIANLVSTVFKLVNRFSSSSVHDMILLARYTAFDDLILSVGLACCSIYHVLWKCEVRVRCWRLQTTIVISAFTGQ